MVVWVYIFGLASVTHNKLSRAVLVNGAGVSCNIQQYLTEMTAGHTANGSIWGANILWFTTH